ncbi:MAG: hypothetical protein ACYC7F_06825 [Gemmatimonadaceae bacterium]
MSKTGTSAPDLLEAGVAVSGLPSVRRCWTAPQLLRMGSVAEVTSKVDKIGRNDGGSGNKRRT